MVGGSLVGLMTGAVARAFAGYTVWTGTMARDPVPTDTRGYGWYDPATVRGGDVFDVGEVTLDDGARQFMWQWCDRGHNELLEREGAVRGGVVHHSLVGQNVPDGVTEMLMRETRRWPGRRRSLLRRA